MEFFIQNKLKREEAFSRLNTAKINEQWRFILRQIKCKEFYEDVTYLWKNFDRMINNKDKIVQLLHVEIKMADIDHRRLQEAHIGIIDKIIGNYYAYNFLDIYPYKYLKKEFFFIYRTIQTKT